jgi:hypothetical protein
MRFAGGEIGDIELGDHRHTLDLVPCVHSASLGGSQHQEHAYAQQRSTDHWLSPLFLAGVPWDGRRFFG